MTTLKMAADLDVPERYALWVRRNPRSEWNLWGTYVRLACAEGNGRVAHNQEAIIVSMLTGQVVWDSEDHVQPA